MSDDRMLPSGRPKADLNWLPSMQLLAVTRNALQQLRGRYPKLMAWVGDNSDDATERESEFAYALRHAALDLIPLAVREWIAAVQKGFPPNAQELGALATELTQQREAELRASLPPAPEVPSPAEERTRDAARRMHNNRDAIAREILTSCGGDTVLAAVASQVLLGRAKELGLVQQYRWGEWPPTEEQWTAIQEARTLDAKVALGPEFLAYLERKLTRRVS